MEWTKEIQEGLGAAFPGEEIEFLPRAQANGRALALAHIDARSVMRRLDAVVGPEGWTFDFEVQTPDCKKVKGRLTVLGVTKSDAGEANAEDEPLKAAVSDALKRCGVHFGIGRYLYYLAPLWVPFDAQKRRFSEAPRLSQEAVERALAICGLGGASAAAEPARREPASRPRAAKLEVAELQGATTTPEAAPPIPSLVCSGDECGRPLTKGQHDISMRAFGQPLCPACQRQQARAA